MDEKRGLIRLRNVILERGFELVFDEDGDRFEHPQTRQTFAWRLVTDRWKEIVQYSPDQWFQRLVVIARTPGRRRDG